MMAKLLSIIIPTLNSEKTLERALLSIRNLKDLRDDIEVIVKDGESKDNTIKIINDLKKIIDKYEVSKDSGIYDAMEKGVKFASGKYLLFMGSDDEIISDTLNKALNSIDDEDFISCAVNIKNENQKILGIWIPSFRRLNFFHKNMQASHLGLITKKELFFKIGGFNKNYKIAADYDFMMRALKMTSDYKIINKPIASFSLGGASYGFISFKENFLIEWEHISFICAVKNFLRRLFSSLIQRMMPERFILFIKQIKNSNFKYIHKK